MMKIIKKINIYYNNDDCITLDDWIKSNEDIENYYIEMNNRITILNKIKEMKIERKITNYHNDFIWVLIEKMDPKKSEYSVQEPGNIDSEYDFSEDDANIDSESDFSEDDTNNGL